MVLRCGRRLLLLALLQELVEALFLLGLNARQFSELCSSGGEQSVEVADFAFGSLSLALFLGNDALADVDLHVERPGLHDGREGTFALQRLGFDERADGGLSGMALSCSKKISASWRLASRASRTQSGSWSFGSMFVTLAASSTSMGAAAEDDEGAVLAALFLVAIASAAMRTSARVPPRGSVRLVQLLLEHGALFAALL